MPLPTFVSYAQNFEDVLLWRALRDVSEGFYIDVGASHPDLDSVTRAFYERGWRGINIEPVSADAARLAAARPRDLTLQLALGRQDGEAELFIVPGTGLSTLDPAVAERYGDPGWALRRGRIAARTLASLCRAHVRGEIHFLKIDVEGAEADVLAGADLLTWRPWIILVEATAPLSTEPAHAAWEPGLVEQGYRFAWFDGLNRFYLAEERADALSVHFRTPPNVFDGFIRANDTSWAERVGSAEARASSAEHTLEASTLLSVEALRRSEARAERGGHEVARLQQALAEEREGGAGQRRVLEAELNLTRHERHAARHELQQTHLRLQAALQECEVRALELEQSKAGLEQNEAELDYTRQVLAGAHHQLHHTTLAFNEAKMWLEAVRRSTSWRLAGPLRVAVRQLKRTPAGPPPAAPLPPPPVPVRPVPAPRPPARALLRVQPPAERAAVRPAAAFPPAAPPPAAPVLPDGFFDVPAAPPVAFPPAARDRTEVHQFHSGSAVADAVTNAMLLTRTVLRGLGYRSEIFVTHRAPELAAELRLIDELPLHDRYVLIVRHSIGHESFDRIAALPAPKILIYHNITPPDLLSRHPTLAAYAALGRRQLGSLRGQVHAALADSVFNAVELHQLGFDAVRACTLLFDIDAMRARAWAAAAQADKEPPDGAGVFTILFVGRICQSKGQIELIAAFNAFRAIYHLPARLVLVGRDEPDHDPYVAAVRRAVVRSAQPREIILTGLVSDAERDGWYARADLYVSLSRHEGFGVPLVEAMAHGVPVLALPSGAVPYTLGGAAILLPEDAGAGRLGAMLDALARDPARRVAHAEAQRASLDRFRLPAQAAILEQALLRAGAALRPERQTRRSLDANLHFAVTGHVNRTYSLAAVNRGLALSLEAARPGRVRLVPVEGVATTDLSEVPAKDAAAVAELTLRPAPLSAPELVISQHYPVHVPPRAAGQIRLALLFWEESLLPLATIATLEKGFDGVVAPTRFVARALQDSGLRLPVRVIPPPPALSAFRAAPRRPGSPVTFLHVSSCFPRKGVDVLLRAWAASFSRGDPVRLLIKSFSNPHNRVADDLAALRAPHANLALVELIEQDLDEAALADLYAQSDVMVLPSRGEGYNLPAAEALAAGLRLIVTGAGGHMDFCDHAGGAIRLLRYRHAASGSHLATPYSLWLEPDADDLASALQEAARELSLDPPPAPSASMPPPADVPAELAGFGLDLLLRPPAEPLRVAWVTSWSQRCGVAEYSRSLLEAIEEDPSVFVTVLCDRRTPDYAALAGEQAHIPCWQTGSAQVEDLLQAIGRADPHAVAVQHQPGLLPWSGLARLIEGVVAAGRVLTVTLHNSRDLLELPPARRDPLLEAFARVDRIIVHTLDDLNRLTRLGLARNVALFPQGIRAPLPARAPRPLGSLDAPVIGSTGFFLPGKGIDTLIEAAVLLRGRWPGLQLRLINAAYGGAESDAEIARCRALAEPLGGSVQFVTSFLPYQQSLEQLGACDLVVLPYRPSREASSAAMRTALTSSVPVAVSRIGLFDEAGEAVLRVRAGTAAELADDLETILLDVEGRSQQQRHAAAWSAAHAWPPIARRLAGLLVGLVRSRASG